MMCQDVKRTVGLALSALALAEGDATLSRQHTQLAAYTRQLVRLYFEVPPDPISFGDTLAAPPHLQQALAMDPDGAWPNFYYGDAEQELQKLQARTPPKP